MVPLRLEASAVSTAGPPRAPRRRSGAVGDQTWRQSRAFDAVALARRDQGAHLRNRGTIETWLGRRPQPRRAGRDRPVRAARDARGDSGDDPEYWPAPHRGPNDRRARLRVPTARALGIGAVPEAADNDVARRRARGRC